MEGSTQVSLDAPLEQIPLLVRAGSILPMAAEEKLILHLYPPMQESSEGCVYSDAGDGYAESRVDHFRMVHDENGLQLTWEQQGDYPFPYKGVQLHLHGFKPQQAWVDSKEVTCQGNELECNSFEQVYFKFNREL
jgi:alpha-glucosidase